MASAAMVRAHLESIQCTHRRTRRIDRPDRRTTEKKKGKEKGGEEGGTGGEGDERRGGHDTDKKDEEKESRGRGRTQEHGFGRVDEQWEVEH